jgi:hypothetical protein
VKVPCVLQNQDLRLGYESFEPRLYYMTSKAQEYLPLVEFLPSRVDSDPAPTCLRHPPPFSDDLQSENGGGVTK